MRTRLFRHFFSLTVMVFSILLLSAAPADAARGAARGVVVRPSDRPDMFQPRLNVTKAEKPVRLVSLAVRTEIQGGFAESTLDMEFLNPNNRILEGELEFPIAPGQEISGLALDINGELRRGVPVSKTRGQEIFEDVARQQVDPALLESTRGNAYRLRVYPLPAKGKRRVVIRIMQPLQMDNGQMRYKLPLTFAGKLENVSVEAIVVSPSGEAKAGAGNLGLRLERAGTVYRGNVERANISPQGWLDISLPASDSLAGSLSAARWKDRLYFTASANVAVPARDRALPDTVTILWDASGSGAERDHAKEYALLDKYFQAFGNGDAHVVVLRDKAESVQRFSVRNGDWQTIKTFLHGLEYDGATNLTDWKPTAECQEYLLFSDGIDNYRANGGKGAFPEMRADQRLFAVSASSTADYAALRALAVRGAVVDLLHDSFDTAVAALLREGVRIEVLGTSLAGVGEAALEPGSAFISGAQKQGVCRLAGWVKRGSEAKEVTVRMVFPDGSVRETPVSLPAWASVPETTGEEAPLQARLWGRYAIAGLEATYQTNRKAIARLGEEFGIVSRETSLIVLETAEDYARYGVTPPEALKEKVNALRVAMVNLSSAPQYLPNDTLARMWADKVAWWEKIFPEKNAKEKPKKVQESGRPLPEAEARDEVTVSERRPHRQRVRTQIRPLTAPSGIDVRAGGEWQFEAGVQGAAETAPGSSVGIRLKPWVSTAPYIARMRAAKDGDLYAIYLDERPGYKNSSAFFLDAADRFFERGMKELGLRVLSNLAEMQLENRQILRMLAYRLMQAGEMAIALPVLEQVRDLAPYEPQSLRDIATVQAALGNTQNAVDLLYETARRSWSDRFGEINTIALTEMNALIAVSGKAVTTDAIDTRFVKNLASDIRVVLAWDMDNTDMDLWVTGPDGETALYSHPRTRMGGRLSRDCTTGYGPEEFMLKKAVPGVYRVEADYYGHSRQTFAGEVTMIATVFSKFGTPAHKEERITLRLKNTKERVLIAEFTVK